MTNKKHNTNKR